jgi:hypothetical protein
LFGRELQDALLKLADLMNEPLILAVNVIAFGASNCVPLFGLGRLFSQLRDFLT